MCILNFSILFTNKDKRVWCLRMIKTFFLKQYNARKQCHRKPRKCRAKTAKNKVRKIMKTQFTVFAGQKEIKVRIVYK